LASRLIQKESFTPAWSDTPLQKSWEKTKPVLGFPRATDSLCPTCVREARQAILDGAKDVSILLNEKVGEINAQIIERDGKILMVKDCPVHGHFEDVMSSDPAMFRHLEEVFPGRDEEITPERRAAQRYTLAHLAHDVKAQRDLEQLGIAKNAREEQILARRKKRMTPEERRHHEEMAKLYRQRVLKEDPTLVSVGMLKATVKQLRLAPTSSSPAPSSPAPSSPAAARADTPPSRC
jgi:hypothetical protein